MLPAIIKVAAVIGGTVFLMKKKRKKGAVGNCSKCGKRSRLQRKQGMVGACCSSCAHGASCESDEEEGPVAGAKQPDSYWDKFYGMARIGSSYRRRRS